MAGVTTKETASKCQVATINPGSNLDCCQFIRKGIASAPNALRLASLTLLSKKVILHCWLYSQAISIIFYFLLIDDVFYGALVFYGQCFFRVSMPAKTDCTTTTYLNVIQYLLGRNCNILCSCNNLHSECSNAKQHVLKVWRSRQYSLTWLLRTHWYPMKRFVVLRVKFHPIVNHRTLRDSSLRDLVRAKHFLIQRQQKYT